MLTSVFHYAIIKKDTLPAFALRRKGRAYANEHYPGAVEEVEAAHRSDPDIVEGRRYMYSLMVKEYGYNIEDHPEEERRLFSELKDEFGKL